MTAPTGPKRRRPLPWSVYGLYLVFAASGTLGAMVILQISFAFALLIGCGMGAAGTAFYHVMHHHLSKRSS